MKAVDKEASKENKTIESKGFKFILSVLFVFLFESSLKLQKKEFSISFYRNNMIYIL